MYIPPFTISANAINLIAEISGQIERYAIRLEQEEGLRLRKANRIKTIHSSLAIEGNTLSEDEVRDILDGKTIVAPLKQIQEVKNAINTYELYPKLNPYNVKDLLKAHGVMMQALVDDAGHFRRSGVGVFSEKGLVHMASFAVVCFTTNLSSFIPSSMAMAEWAACGSRLYWANCIPYLNICQWRTWYMPINKHITMPSPQVRMQDSRDRSSISC